MVDSPAPADSLVLPERISPQAQRALAAKRPKSVYPPLDDPEAWRRRRAAIEQQVVPMFAGLTANLKVSTETLSLGGVTVYDSTPEGLAEDLRDCALLEIHGGALVAMAALLGVFFKDGSATLPPNVGVAVIAVACVFVSAFAWSWGPLGWLVPAEVQPLETRSVGQGINVSVNFLVRGGEG